MIRELLCIKLHSMIFQQVFQYKDGMILENINIGHFFVVHWLGIQTLRALECYNITGTSAITKELKRWGDKLPGSTWMSQEVRISG